MPTSRHKTIHKDTQLVQVDKSAKPLKNDTKRRQRVTAVSLQPAQMRGGVHNIPLWCPCDWRWCDSVIISVFDLREHSRGQPNCFLSSGFRMPSLILSLRTWSERLAQPSSVCRAGGRLTWRRKRDFSEKETLSNQSHFCSHNFFVKTK